MVHKLLKSIIIRRIFVEMEGKLLSCWIGFCITRLAVGKVCEAVASRASHGLQAILRVGSCEGQRENVGECLVQVLCLLPHPVSI